MATNPAQRILDTFNASEEQAEHAERDAATCRAAWDDRVRRLLTASDPACDHTITPTAGKGMRAVNAVVNTTGKNYYRDWAVKWLVLADSLREGGWLPSLEAIRSYLESEDGKKSDLTAFGRAAEMLAGVLELNKDHKKDIKTLADALGRLHRRDGYQTLGGELGGLVQAMTRAEYQVTSRGWPESWGPVPIGINLRLTSLATVR